MGLRTLLSNLRWALLALAGLSLWVAASATFWLVNLVFLLLGIVLLGLGLWLLTAYTRPNCACVNPDLQMEVWDVTHDDEHNSNTDLILWNGSFYLVHAASPFHLASEKCRLVLLRSADAREWQKLAEFSLPGEDIRDPKLAAIGGRLFLYVLKNRDFNPEPYSTAYTSSLDGETWEPLRDVEPAGWLFWRPKTRDGATWYVPAYWWEHGKSQLFTSHDGIRWTAYAPIYQGDRNDETDVEFLTDGRMISTARLEFSESVFGHPQGSTAITLATLPYKDFQLQARDPLTRLDGPALFSLDGAVYAVGRFQPEIRGPFMWPGSAFSRKRTALFRLLEDRLVYLSDLPSAGDTSYSGVVVRGEDVYICYYTSDITHDYPWIVGMLNPTAIKMVRIPNACLAQVAKEKLAASN